MKNDFFPKLERSLEDFYMRKRAILQETKWLWLVRWY